MADPIVKRPLFTQVTFAIIASLRGIFSLKRLQSERHCCIPRFISLSFAIGQEIHIPHRQRGLLPLCQLSNITKLDRIASRCKS